MENQQHLIALWIDLHHEKGLGEIYEYKYLAKPIPTGFSIRALDKNGEIESKISRRIDFVTDEIKPSYSNNHLFSVTGRVWCKPEQITEAKEILIEGLKTYTQTIIDNYSVTMVNLKTMLNSI